MITLSADKLEIKESSLPDGALLSVSFKRTLRVPEDGAEYPLPPAVGTFPLIHVDELPHSVRIPEQWRSAGGVVLPMYPSEALWIEFASSYIRRRGRYPFAIKVATGKINALTGEPLLNNSPCGARGGRQDYVVVPKQPWLDGFCVAPGFVRQFVAVTAGYGRTVEEQAWGWQEHGGIQFLCYAMAPVSFEHRFPLQPEREQMGLFARNPRQSELGLGAGGRIRQRIYEDEYGSEEWAPGPVARLFVRIVHALDWQHLTGLRPPHLPVSVDLYRRAGLPWFSEYSDGTVVAGSEFLGKLKGVIAPPAPRMTRLEHRPPMRVVDIQTGKVVREGEF
jgi:hypothetical protein